MQIDTNGGCNVKWSKPDSESQNNRFSLICGRETQKVNIYTKTSNFIYKLVCRTTLWNSGK
jgi:hypothetical protein